MKITMLSSVHAMNFQNNIDWSLSLIKKEENICFEMEGARFFIHSEMFRLAVGPTYHAV